MRNIAVVGTGYVGLVTGTCLAELKHKVICVDSDLEKINRLKEGIMPIYEPGLKGLVTKNVLASRLSFSTDINEAVRRSEVIFIAVGTPPLTTGEANLCSIEEVAAKIGSAMDSYKVIVEKSTVPVRTGQRIKETIKAVNSGVLFDVVSNPEFLREGSAIEDFMHPDRIIIGTDSQKAAQIMKEIYSKLNSTVIVTDINSAELIKHASNSFLALKISYINAIANICERVGADVVCVAEGIGLDSRIGRAYLDAGIGYGGPCLPKDIDAFIKFAWDVGYNFSLLKEIKKINQAQRRLLINKIKDLLLVLADKTICILGLSFKPNTDDVRNAPSIEIINMLKKEGAKIKAYCPAGMENAKKVISDIEYCNTPYEAAEGADALVILTEWDVFRELDLRKIKSKLNRPIIVDGRNIYDPEKMKALGFIYKGIGR